MLAFTRTGSGDPLLLLHGIGMSRQAWDPLIPLLAGHFDVIAVDLPGFGRSPIPAGGRCDPAGLAREVGDLLDQLGISSPHVVGNSLGGWTGLELAGQRDVATLTLLSPAGLWHQTTPAYCRVSLRASRWLARRLTRPLSWAVRWKAARVAVLGQTHGHPSALTADEARRAIRDLGESPGFAAVFAATARICYAPAEPVRCPVTVAFGSRDWLLRPRRARFLDTLPADCRLAALPGCGHVPMSDDPPAVAALITESASVRV